MFICTQKRQEERLQQRRGRVAGSGEHSYFPLLVIGLAALLLFHASAAWTVRLSQYLLVRADFSSSDGERDTVVPAAARASRVQSENVAAARAGRLPRGTELACPQHTYLSLSLFLSLSSFCHALVLSFTTCLFSYSLQR